MSRKYFVVYVITGWILTLHFCKYKYITIEYQFLCGSFCTPEGGVLFLFLLLFPLLLGLTAWAASFVHLSVPVLGVG